MSQFNTTPLSYTGAEFSDTEKAQFRVDWGAYGSGDNINVGNIVSSSDISTGDDFILTKNESSRLLGTASDESLAALIYLDSSDNLRLGSATNINSTELYDTGVKKLTTTSTGIDITGDVVASGTVTATSFSPFTGCHIAKSDEDLQLGELVQIKSAGWINPKQPDWKAEYCNGSKKGIYGVVYDIINVEAVEAQEATEDTEAVEAAEAYIYYYVAATGDGFMNIDCPCEYGDVLIPSETKGLATVCQGEYLPLNMVGFAGEDSEGGKIAYTKE